jgi:putative ABC transport system permease protein
MLKMAFRNIFRQKRRSLLTALAMVGGYVLTALAIGLNDGTYNSIINAFTRDRLGHVQIHAEGYLKRPSLSRAIANYRDIGRVIEKNKNAEAWAPRVYSAGLASVGECSDAARIIGLDPIREVKATRFDKKIIHGRNFSDAASKEIIFGTGLARALKASPGNEVVIVSQGADGSLANEKYRLVGLAESGDLASDRNSMYLHIDDVRELLVLGDKVHEIVIIARSLKDVAGLNASLRRDLAGRRVEVLPWQEFARAFYSAMRSDEKGSQVTLLVLFIIVAIGVLNTALMSVLERRREYGVLKALGTRPRQVFGLILLEINLLALMSILLGFSLSLPLNFYLSQHQFPISTWISEPITYGGMQYLSFTSEVNARSFIVPAVTVLVSAFLVSLIPAIKASRTEPARSIRIF